MNHKQYAIWMRNLISTDKKCRPSNTPAKLMSAVASLLKCSTVSKSNAANHAASRWLYVSLW
jgi:hypothetical protein